VAESANDLANSQLKAFGKGFQVHIVAISMHGTTTVEHTFCELEKVLAKNEVPFNKLVCSVTDGSPAGTRSKNGTVGKLNEKRGGKN
jgi:glycine/serine hydroxymethyltransferase